MQVHAALAEATNARRTPVSRGGAYTFELVQHAPSGPGGGKSEGSAQYTATACATAVKVFHSALSPLVMDDGQDMCAPPPCARGCAPQRPLRKPDR